MSRSAKLRLGEIARTASRALWVRDFARLDVRLSADDRLWVLEVNANPYLSYGHEISKSADKAGMDHERFIERIVLEAWRRYERGVAVGRSVAA